MTPTEYLTRPYSRVVVPESDGTFRGEILEFPGCLAAGDTAEETLSRLENVAASWLQSMIDRRQEIPEPFEANNYSGKLVLRLSKSVHRKAAIAARMDGVSLNHFIANCVAEYVGARNHHVHVVDRVWNQQPSQVATSGDKRTLTLVWQQEVANA
jgi:predicted HicB family RNase H-like nuclease